MVDALVCGHPCSFGSSCEAKPACIRDIKGVQEIGTVKIKSIGILMQK